MTDFQNLLNPALIILIIILTGFSFYIYRFNNPPLPLRIKIILISLRCVSLILLLFALFNSAFIFTQSRREQTHNIFFIDNSKSVSCKDSIKRVEAINKFISSFSGSGKNLFFTFGTRIDSLSKKELNINGTYTNFEDIETFLSGRRDAASAVIVSDGIITDGSNPLYNLGKLGIPVYTVGVGDTTLQRDVTLLEPQYSTPIYRNHTYSFDTKIINNNLAGKEVTVSFSSENKVIQKKNLILSQAGVDNISFNYSPPEEGEKRFSVSISPVTGETNTNNNSRSFIVKVLNDRIKVFLISGSPSPDVTPLSTILTSDEKIKLKSVTELNEDKQITGGSSTFPTDSTDLFILLNYPGSNPNKVLFKQVKDLITLNRKPVIFITGSGTDLLRLQEFSALLPFTLGNRSSEELQVEVYSDLFNSPLTASADNALWELLPPVVQTKTEFIPKKESEVLLKTKIKNNRTNIPAAISLQNESSKSLAITCTDIWRWKLQPDDKSTGLFDKFLLNCVQWLNTPGQKKLFSIKTAKKIYSTGERIEITGSLVDELSNPVENGSIIIKAMAEPGTFTFPLAYTGNGMYKGEIENTNPGNLKIAGSVKIGNKVLSDSLKLFVEKTELEYLNTQMDLIFLKQAAAITGGSFYSIENYMGLASEIEKAPIRSLIKPEKIQEFRFASNEIILIILVLLFSLEWTIRKIYRLL